jgi:hypothetical protein
MTSPSLTKLLCSRGSRTTTSGCIEGFTTFSQEKPSTALRDVEARPDLAESGIERMRTRTAELSHAPTLALGATLAAFFALTRADRSSARTGVVRLIFNSWSMRARCKLLICLWVTRNRPENVVPRFAP